MRPAASMPGRAAALGAVAAAPAAPVADAVGGRVAAGVGRTVLMAGPLPPAVGGMASVLGALQASTLPGRVDLRLFQTGKTTPPGRPLWQGVRARLALIADWWRAVGERPPPLVHLHTCSGLTFFLDGLLLLIARARGAPVVLHVHGARFDAFLDGLAAPAAALARAIARRASVVVALSPEWQQRLAARWPGIATVVVANGVETPAVASAVDAPGVPTFVFVGGLSRRKGVDVLLQAAALGRESWRVALAGGDDEPGFGAWVTSEIGRLGVAGRVRRLGVVVGDAKTALLAGAQGFVLPSRAEGLPMALLEAMAAGLPAVVTAVGAMAEVVRDGVDGEVVASADDDALAAALAAALDRLARDPERRRRLGTAAAERCRALYGVERMVDALLGVYAGSAATSGVRA